MPVMPRLDKKDAKIIYNIIGKPANLAYKRTKKQEYIEQQLLREETVRSR